MVHKDVELVMVVDQDVLLKCLWVSGRQGWSMLVASRIPLRKKLRKR
jgi:hypothetical protein